MVVAAIAWFVWNSSGSRSGPPVDAPAPAITLPTLDGDEFSTSDHTGQVMVLDFWATWCPPCIKTLPALQKVKEHYKRDPEVVIAAVNTDQTRDRERLVGTFMRNNRYDFRVVLDDDRGQAQTAYRVASIPTMVVVDAGGIVRRVVVGVHASNTDKIAENIISMVEETKGR